ncbi:MAG: GEVED domain-containing protein, partial [Gemmatimonadales bacterium]
MGPSTDALAQESPTTVQGVLLSGGLRTQGEAQGPAADVAQFCDGIPGMLVVGQFSDFNGSIQNIGGGPLTGLILEITVTPELQLSNYGTDRGQWTVQQPQNGRLDVGTLNPNELVNFQFRLTAVAPGDATTEFRVTANEIEEQIEQCNTVVEPLPPNIDVTKRDVLQIDNDGDGQADPSDTIEYAIVIANLGGGAATGVTFNDTPDANTTLVAGSVTTTQGNVTQGNGADDTQVGVDVGNIAGVGGFATITFWVIVDDPFPAGVVEVCNQGDVAGNNIPDEVTDDPDIGGQDDPTCTPIDAAPDLTLAKDDGEVAVLPGEVIVYMLHYANEGNRVATGVEITETLPANTLFDAAGSTAGWVNQGGGVYTFDVGALGVGVSGTADFAVRVDDPLPEGVDQITNTATIADDGRNGADPNLENNDADDITPIRRQDFDFGDAPDPSYPTLLTNDGARHVIPPGGAMLYLGTTPPDPDNDGQPTATADGDDEDGNDDEDGVEFTSELVVGQVATVAVTTSAAGRLDAWVDVNNDGDWNDTGEKIIDNVSLGRGTFQRSFLVPPTVQGDALFARFRYSSQGGLLPTGQAADGEVEDYQVAVRAEADIELSKTASSDVADVGTDVTFTLSLTNQGPSPATGVMVTDRLPDCLDFVRANPMNRYNPMTGRWNVGALGAGQSATLDITATVTEACPNVVTNTAEVTASDVMDPDSEPGDGQGDDFDEATLTARDRMIGVSPVQVNFDNTDVCAVGSGIVTVENTGNADVQITGVAIEGPDSAFFEIVSGGGAGLLLVSGSRVITVQFAPRRAGAHTATLVVASDARGGDERVSLRGDGVALVLQEPQVSTPVEAGQEVRVRVVSPGTFDPTERLLFYRRGGETTFNEVSLQSANGALEGIIPAAFVTVQGVEYYVRLANACATLTFPEGAPDSASPRHLPVAVLQLDAEGVFPTREYRMVS